MHTINIRTLSPLTVAAALRSDDDATVNDLPANEYLTRYWRAQIRAILPQPHDEEPAQALSRLADALAVEDITQAVDFAIDYREFTGRPGNTLSLSSMIAESLLDWSKWCGIPRIDNARAQSWLRSLLT